MTIHLEWLRTGRAPRGKPQRAGSPRRGVALVLLAAMAMTAAGCTSGPFSNCGSCNSCGFLRRTTARIFNRPSGCCGSGTVGDAGVEYGAPSTVVGPGATTVGPMYSPGPSTGSIPSTVPQSDAPTILSPNNEVPPSVRPGPAPSTGATSGSGGSRTSYVTRPSATKTAVRLDAGMTPDRASIARPTKETPADDAGLAAAGPDDNPLDRLPPLALPGEVTQAAGSPVPPAARPEGVSPAGDGVSLLGPDAAEPETPAGAGRSGSPGSRRSTRCSPAGACRPPPGSPGWRKRVTGRCSTSAPPARSVPRSSPRSPPAACATSPCRSSSTSSRPSSSPASSSNWPPPRPAPSSSSTPTAPGPGRSGTSAASRSIASNPQIARREAAAIGLKDPSAWQLTTTYLERLEADKAHPGNATAPARTGAAEPPTPPAAAATSDAPAIETGPLDAPTITMPVATTTSRPAEVPLGSLPSRSNGNWRPIAAMLITGLGLPLVYWSRTASPRRSRRPRPVCRHRHLDLDRFPASRVIEQERSRMKCDPGSPVLRDDPRLRPVSQVADNRQPPARELDAELMAPTRRRPQLQPGFPRPTLHDAEGHLRLPAPLLGCLQRPRTIGAPVLLQTVDPRPLIDARMALDDRPVDLGDRPLAELGR